MIKDILSGLYDSQLAELSEAIKTRKAHLAQINFFDFKVGDKVKFNGLTRPTYLQGCEAIIRDKKTKNIVVDLISPPPGSRFNKGIRTSVNLVEKV
jgi:hypothetical protein